MSPRELKFALTATSGYKNKINKQMKGEKLLGKTYFGSKDEDVRQNAQQKKNRRTTFWRSFYFTWFVFILLQIRDPTVIAVNVTLAVKFCSLQIFLSARRKKNPNTPPPDITRDLENLSFVKTDSSSSWRKGFHPFRGGYFSELWTGWNRLSSLRPMSPNHHSSLHVH